MRALKVLGTLVVLLVIAVVIMAAMGSRLPHAHTASATVALDASQPRVWQWIDDNASQPAWRTGLKSVTPLPDRDGHPCWQENNSMGKMPMCEVSANAPSSRTVRIADPTLPFGGEWAYELASEAPGRTRLTITENGTTGPAIWRFLGHYVFHEDTMIKQYEHDLQQRVAQGS